MRMARCPKCDKVQQVNFKSKPLDNGIDEIGIECSGCGYWHVAYWLNEELKEAQIPKASRKHRREYERKFKKFQRKMRKIAHNASTSIAHTQGA